MDDDSLFKVEELKEKLKRFERNQIWVKSLSVIIGMIALLVSLADLLAIQTVTEKLVNFLSDQVSQEFVYETLKLITAIIAGALGMRLSLRLRKHERGGS